MPELKNTSNSEIESLRARLKKLSMDKSYNQLIIRLLNKISAAPGLENTIDALLRNIMDVIGGANIILYYFVDKTIFYRDVFGKHHQVDSIDDNLVLQSIETRQPLEIEQNFKMTKMRTPKFGKGYTWIFPLLFGSDLIGVLRMENLLLIRIKDLYRHLPTFFNYAALILNNEILGYSKLRKINTRLEKEIAIRKQREKELHGNLEDLERFNRLTVDREEMMIQLKVEINTLMSQMGQEKKYKIVK